MSKKIDNLWVDNTPYNTEIPTKNNDKYSKVLSNPYEIRAIIPGTVIEVRVNEGQKVSRDQVVILLEAMKMYNEIEAGIDGLVKKIHVSQGDRLEKNQIIIELEAQDVRK